MWTKGSACANENNLPTTSSHLLSHLVFDPLPGPRLQLSDLDEVQAHLILPGRLPLPPRLSLGSIKVYQAHLSQVFVQEKRHVLPANNRREAGFQLQGAVHKTRNGAVLGARKAQLSKRGSKAAQLQQLLAGRPLASSSKHSPLKAQSSSLQPCSQDFP